MLDVHRHGMGGTSVRIEDTCPCGAKFAAESWIPVAPAEAYEAWLRAHRSCRELRGTS